MIQMPYNKMMMLGDSKKVKIYYYGKDGLCDYCKYKLKRKNAKNK